MSPLLQNSLFFRDLKPIRDWLKKLITCYHAGDVVTIAFDVVYSYLAYENKYIKIGSQFLFIPLTEGRSSNNKQISLILNPRGENFIFFKTNCTCGIYIYIP